MGKSNDLANDEHIAKPSRLVPLQALLGRKYKVWRSGEDNQCRRYHQQQVCHLVSTVRNVDRSMSRMLVWWRQDPQSQPRQPISPTEKHFVSLRRALSEPWLLLAASIAVVFALSIPSWWDVAVPPTVNFSCLYRGEIPSPRESDVLDILYLHV